MRRRRVALLLLCGLLCCAVVSTGMPATAAAGYTKKQKRVIRAKMLKQLKKNPRLVRKRWFLRKASHVEFALPLTARLAPSIRTTTNPAIPAGEFPNDSLELGLGSDPATAPAGVYASTVTVPIQGKFSLTGKFGTDTIGYGTLGVLELGAGNVDLLAQSFPIINASPGCGDGDALLKTGPVAISEAPAQPSDRRGGYLNWFTGDISFRLWTSWEMNSLRRDLCTDPFFWTNRITSSSASIIPIDLVGSFKVSPAITTDGKLRFLKVAAQDAVIAQPSLFARLHYCREVTAVPDSSPAPATACAVADDATVDGRIKVRDLTFEVLIGDG